MDTHSARQWVTVTVDFETYYDSDYSLRKLSALSYIRDARFEVHMMSWMSPDLGVGTPRRAFGADQVAQVVELLRTLRNKVYVRLCGHNLAFDALILSEVFGYVPDGFFDTSVLCNWVYSHELKSRKLEVLAEKMALTSPPHLRREAFDALGLIDDGNGKKISAALAKVKGKRWEEIARDDRLRTAYAAYCDIDVSLTHQAYTILSPQIPQATLQIQDLYVAALVTTPVQLDAKLLASLRDTYIDDRDAEIEAFGDVLASCGIAWEGIKSIRSKDKFAELLAALGVEDQHIPRKPGKNGLIYAFAKDDMAMDVLPEMYPEQELLPEAIRLRLEYNSSNTESKLRSFSAVATTGDWAFHVKPFGAPNTVRHSGGSATGNSPQNLKRAKETFAASCVGALRFADDIGVRDAIMAKPGRVLVVADLSGIELRTCMFWCKDHEAMAILSDPKRDMYVEDGRVYFNMPSMTKKDKPLRQAAKVADLSCLAGDTEVLTARGWIPIVEVKSGDLVWDGVNWVHTDGVLYRGERVTLVRGGIRMTPDHLIEHTGYGNFSEAIYTHDTQAVAWGVRHLPDSLPCEWAGVCWADDPLHCTEQATQSRPPSESPCEPTFAERFQQVRCGDIHYNAGGKVQRELGRTRAGGSGYTQEVREVSSEPRGVCALSGAWSGACRRTGSPHIGGGGECPEVTGGLLEVEDYPRVRGMACESQRFGESWATQGADRPCDECQPHSELATGSAYPRTSGETTDAHDVPSCQGGVRERPHRSTESGYGREHERDLGECERLRRRAGSKSLHGEFPHQGAYRYMSRAHTDVCEPVYDLLNCGERHAFMVRSPTHKLPMLVHNCQYLVGHRKILHSAKLMKVPMTAEMAQALHSAYRTRHPAVVQRWGELEKFMRDLAQGIKFEVDMHPVVLTERGIHSPTGFIMRYSGIQYSYRERRFTYWNATKGCRVNLHAGMIVENVSQNLAASVFNHQHLTVHPKMVDLYDGQFVGSVHDELIYDVPIEHGRAALSTLLLGMEGKVPWWQELVTWGEGDTGFALLEHADGSLDYKSRYGCLK